MYTYIEPVGRTGRRVARRPVHTFQVRHVPFTIQPFMLAPVLPGETLQNLLLQARAVTDPIKNPLTGWWLEYYFFYVKHRDMSVRADLEQMMLDPAFSIANIDATTAVVQDYFAGNGINWTNYCLEAVITEYFRNEGETWNQFTITPAGGTAQPIASIAGNSWTDSLKLESAMAASEALVINPSGSDLTGQELDVGWRNYQMLKLHGLVEQSYEDYLRSFGVSVAEPEDPYRPELLRYVRDWTYPTNTIDPSNGTPRSAVSWSTAERADKNRFFPQPGFIFGVTVCRPKTYNRNQIGSAAWFLNDVRSWLAAALANDPMSSLVEVDGSIVSPLTIASANFMVDTRDLFIYGDQFINFDPAATDANMLALPEADTDHRYPANVAAIDEMFVTAGTNKCRQDGVVNLTILGRQRDTTPTEAAGT